MYSGGFNMDVNPVKQGTGNAILVFGHNRRAQGQGIQKYIPIAYVTRRFPHGKLDLFPQNMKPAMLA
jgi:hypothetical protein